jgi:tetratricopeptide (TPR) repeat protein
MVAVLQADRSQLNEAKILFGRAVKNAKQVEDSFDRDVVWSKIAEGQASAGMVEESLTTAKSIGDGWEYSRALASIAQIQSSLGDKRKANEIFKKAVEEAESFQDYNNFLPATLGFIIEKMLEANEGSEAKAILERITEPTARVGASLMFANNQIELGQPL